MLVGLATLRKTLFYRCHCHLIGIGVIKTVTNEYTEAQVIGFLPQFQNFMLSTGLELKFLTQHAV